MNLKAALALSVGGDLAHLSEVARQLAWLGLEVELGGRLIWGPVRILGKGTNGVVVLCRSPHGDIYACKIRRGDAQRPHLLEEARYLKMANGVGVGPRLYAYTKDVLVMEYMKGTPVAEWWSRADPMMKRAFVEDLLRQARALDAIGLSHGELSRPGDHILASDEGKAVILDFESASLGRARNVTQVANMLRALGLPQPVDALRRYAERLDDRSFEEVLTFFLDELNR